MDEGIHERVEALRREIGEIQKLNLLYLQCDRLANSYEALGNALAARGEWREAVEDSSKAVEIRKSLVAADPTDARG